MIRCKQCIVKPMCQGPCEEYDDYRSSLNTKIANVSIAIWAIMAVLFISYSLSNSGEVGIREQLTIALPMAVAFFAFCSSDHITELIVGKPK